MVERERLRPILLVLDLALVTLLFGAIVALSPRCLSGAVLAHDLPYKVYIPIVVVPERPHILPGGW